MSQRSLSPQRPMPTSFPLLPEFAHLSLHLSLSPPSVSTLQSPGLYSISSYHSNTCSLSFSFHILHVVIYIHHQSEYLHLPKFIC